MMLENFVWQPAVLQRLSRRQSDGASLPEAAIAALSASRGALEGLARCRYVAMALFDLAVHSGPPPYASPFGGAKQVLDCRELYDALISKLGEVPALPGTFPVASWYHPMVRRTHTRSVCTRIRRFEHTHTHTHIHKHQMGYDAGYYSYLWSEAFAADLFGEFEANCGSILDPKLGARYKECILAPCATVDGDAMLRGFLGREPSLQRFFGRLTRQCALK